MRVTIQKSAAIILGFYLMHASAVFAEDAKVPDSVTEEVVEAEKQTPEQEETEEGEASGNVEDCEPAHEADDAQEEVEEKNLDECEPMIK